MFKECLDKGREKEREFAIKMIRKELDILRVEFAPDEVFKDWDVKLTRGNGKEETYEVKSDDKSMETGNMCFEFACNGEPSGIFNSKADYVVYYAGGEYYIKERSKLLANLMCINDKKVVDGGDGKRAKMFLVSKSKLDLLFNKI